jgi:hypothetical protein
MIYKVSWSAEVEADSPTEAASMALTILLNPGPRGRTFDISQDFGQIQIPDQERTKELLTIIDAEYLLYSDAESDLSCFPGPSSTIQPTIFDPTNVVYGKFTPRT